jgi:hypothetical protein
MPYKIKRNSKGGWDIVRKADNKVVGHSTNIAKARASIGYRMSGEKKKA